MIPNEGWILIAIWLGVLPAAILIGLSIYLLGKKCYIYLTGLFDYTEEYE